MARTAKGPGDEERYRVLVELANSIILRLDTSGRILFINEFGEEFFGYKKEELLGKHLVGTLAPRVESSGRDLAHLMRSILEDPDTHRINENENVKKDGSRAWVLWTNKAVVDGKGRVVEIISVGSEITHRKEQERLLRSNRDRLAKEVEERGRELERLHEDLRYEVVETKIRDVALSESEVKYRSIVEDAVEGIFQTTGEGEYILANAAFARMLGYSSSREFMTVAAATEPELYVNPEERAEYRRLLGAKGYVKAFETRFYRKDGSEIWVSMNVRAVRDSLGGFMCYEGTIEDITERKRHVEDLRQSFLKLQRVMEGTVKALSRAIEMRDPYTAGHQQRVALLAVEIAKGLDFPEEHVRAVQVAATVHDVGKIYVPSEILTRPGKVSAHEFAVLRDHCEAGYEILKDIEFDYPIARIVLQHHERLDGSGYPQGLSGDLICLDARILGVADVIESMASHRPYRPSLGLAKALKEIQQNSGILYDEKVVAACLKLFREKGFVFREPSTPSDEFRRGRNSEEAR